MAITGLDEEVNVCMRVIVAFPKLEDAKNMRQVLMRNGFEDTMACNSASQVISAANDSEGGVVVCGYRLADMHYSELFGYLPREFPMLLVASPARLEECYSQDIVCLAMPVRSGELVGTVRMMTADLARELRRRGRDRPGRRSVEERSTIDSAKALLMERNQMTEGEAHKYIQKLSMDSGNNLVETAEMILLLNGGII